MDEKPNVRVTVKSMKYGTRMLTAGDEVHMPTNDKRLLVALKKVVPITGKGREPAKIPSIPRKVAKEAAPKEAAPKRGSKSGRSSAADQAAPAASTQSKPADLDAASAANLETKWNEGLAGGEPGISVLKTADRPEGEESTDAAKPSELDDPLSAPSSK